MTTPVRLGMIGCGLISHAHGRAALKSDRNIRFIACASRRAEAARAWADTYGCANAYTDIAEMLRHETLDGVVIATWPADHRRHIEMCLAAGVRFILCEKALTTGADDALAIWQTAAQTGATIVEGFMYRHHPAIRRLEEMMGAGDPGRLDSIHGVFHMFDPEEAEPQDTGRGWRQRPEAGGGVPFDFLCYPVDAANHFAKAPPMRVFARGGRSAKYGTINRLYGLIEYENGCFATVESSRTASFDQTLRLTGARAILELPVAWSIPGDVTITRTESPAFLARETTTIAIPQSEPNDGRLIDFPVFKWQLENFAEVIRGTATPRMPLTASVVNIFVLEALVASFHAAEPVDITLPEDIAQAEYGGRS